MNHVCPEPSVSSTPFAATHNTSSVAASHPAKPDPGKPPAKKRQRSILDFAIAAKLQQQGAGDSATTAAGEISTPGAACVSHKSLLISATRFHLMVQRPEEGLLAGLWEFPGEGWGKKKEEKVNKSEKRRREQEKTSTCQGTGLQESPAMTQVES